jgi:hypothetical protein
MDMSSGRASLLQCSGPVTGVLSACTKIPAHFSTRRPLAHEAGSGKLKPMLVRIKTGSPNSSDRPGRKTRRIYIYPHRSVRALPVTAFRLVAALSMAALLCGLTAYYAIELMNIHGRIAGFLMEFASIPTSGWEAVAIFPGLQPALAPVTTIPLFHAVTDGARMTLIAAIVILLLVSRHYVLTRSLAGFLIFLLIVSALVNSLKPDLHFESQTFGQIWLRGEMLVWLLMPWVSALLFVLPQPNIAEGFGWALLTQAYCILFSALRMVFSLGVLHHTGMLFLPLIWFGMGTLSDLVFLLFFYSISVYRASGRVWGLRSIWKS